MRKIKLVFLILIILFVQCTDDSNEPPTQKISAQFTASSTHISAGESVTFTDQSTGNPSEWSWTFEGGNPGSSNEKNPVVTYNTPGIYQVSLNAASGNSESDLLKEDFITVEVGSFQLDAKVTFGLSVRTDFMQSMVVLEDNSLVCAGWADNESTQESRTNILVTKFDPDLNLVWNKIIGGSSPDLVRQIISTEDGGFLLSAITESNDGDIPENKGGDDISIIKLNSTGSIVWVKNYGGSGSDGVNNNSLVKFDNGYAFIAYTESEDAGISGMVGAHDIWLNELDLNGNSVNSIVVGSVENDYPYSFVKTSAGYTVLSKIGAATNDFNKPGIWLFNVNSTGTIVWKTYIDGFNAGKLIQTQDGGYATLNTRRMNVTDLFVTKFDHQGNVLWETDYPLPHQEFAEDIIQVNDEYIILGSSEPQVNIPRNGYAYVAKLNESGQVIQSAVFGDGKISAKNILETGNGKYIMGGTKNVAESYIDSEFLLQSLSDLN